MTEQFTNLAQTILNTTINNSTTTVIAQSAANFPGSGNFRIVIDTEIMLVTGVSGTTFTVTRGYESTTATSHNSGALLTHVLTAGSLSQIITDNKPLTYATALCSADTSMTSGSWTDIAGCSISLAAGTWFITAYGTFTNTGVTNSAQFKIYYGSTDLAGAYVSLNGGYNFSFPIQVIAVLGSTQTVKFAGKDDAGQVFQIFQFLTGTTIPGTAITAIKIA